MNNKALVLLSGGQDSAICLAWALQKYSHVETIGFNYGQRHVIEMDCRSRVLEEFKEKFPDLSKNLGQDHVLDLSLLGQISDTALTQNREIEISRSGLPSTFVPMRNIAFFTFSASVAYRREIQILVGGMCETDYSGYPDCRENTLQALQVALSLGLDSRMQIKTPLMWKEKSEIWRLAWEIGGLAMIDLIRDNTHSCYLGNREAKYSWGYGCGACPACKLRSEGYDQFRRIITEKAEQTTSSIVGIEGN